LTQQVSSTQKLIAAGLTEEIDGFNKFKALLLTEQEALISGDTTALSEITESKDVHAQKLNELAAERTRLINSLGFADSREGIAQWLSQSSEPLVAQWNTLLKLAKEIQHLNEVNGKLIQTRLQYTQQTLSALLTAVNQANLYGPTGQPSAAPQSANVRGIIGKA